MSLSSPPSRWPVHCPAGWHVGGQQSFRDRVPVGRQSGDAVSSGVRASAPRAWLDAEEEPCHRGSLRRREVRPPPALATELVRLEPEVRSSPPGSLKMELQQFPVRGPNEFDGAFSAMTKVASTPSRSSRNRCFRPMQACSLDLPCRTGCLRPDSRSSRRLAAS